MRKMLHTITISSDGSSTLQLTGFNETYHSINGAYTEAMHIYIGNGLEHLFHKTCSSSPAPHPIHINIFDIGFGTALNCILSYVWQQQLRQRGLPYPRITYYGIEKYPIPLSETKLLNYPSTIAGHTGFPPDKVSEIFHLMHSCQWEEDIVLPYPEGSDWNSPTENRAASHPNGDFTLHKTCADISTVGREFYREAGRDSTGEERIIPSVVYYDTFSPATQPELWDEAIFRNIAGGCAPGSILTTYCSKGCVKQALRNAGFTLERLGGPPGKRHILRGTL